MAPIDIGPGAIDRDGSYISGYTTIDKANPANASGILASVEVRAHSALSGCKVGTFYQSGGAGEYTCRDYTVIGSVPAGSKQTFSGLSIDVEAGDLLGIYFSDGYIEANESGQAGIYSLSGDHFESGEQAFDFYSGDAVSIYATGFRQIQLSPTETTGLADQVTKGLVASRVFSESLSITPSNIVTLAKMFPEIVALADDVEAIGEFVRLYAEALGLGDTTAKALVAAIADDLSLSDAVSKALTAIMQGETLALDDSLTLTRLVILLETLSLADQVGTLATLTRLLSETLQVADSKAFQFMRALAEALPVADSVVKAVSLAMVEGVALDDATAKALARQLADELGLSDDIVMAGVKVLATDTLGLSDAMSKTATFGRILAELVAMGDRLRLGGVWDDPNIKIVVSLLKAAMRTELRRDSTEASIRKGSIDTEAR